VPRAAGPAVHRLADFVGVAPDSEVIARLEWAGLLSDRPIPEVERRLSPLDIFGNRLAHLMVYKPGERDMIALRHTFSATFPDGHRQDITSSLVVAGEPFGDTAMARTVSLPAAIAANLILRGELTLVGVHIPVAREIYDPVLDELEELGIRVNETRTTSYPGPLS
jgi:saccharopine dehydrogenase-like NADP-dependent oxidoreductase